MTKSIDESGLLIFARNWIIIAVPLSAAVIYKIGPWGCVLGLAPSFLISALMSLSHLALSYTIARQLKDLRIWSTLSLRMSIAFTLLILAAYGYAWVTQVK